MTTAFISHPDTLLHVMDGNHPESPARITAIKNALTKLQLLQKLEIYDAPEATDADLVRVHNIDYVRNIRKLAPKAGLVRLDADTAMGPMSLSACLHASGAVLLATDLVMQGKAKNAFCCVRPPGHHAGVAHSAGFCIFNHVAVGVAYVIQKYKLKRVAIIDFDVHHGDGTEDIFKHHSGVMLCSTFQHPFYPHRGADTRSDRMINVPLAAKTDGKMFREIFLQEFIPALDDFKPEFIFVSAGFDAHKDDPLADLSLNNTDYQWLAKVIMSISNKYSQNRIVASLEGGYDLSALAEASSTFIKALME